MSQNIGWFKLYREKLVQFSTDPYLNISLFNVFTYLVSNAVWEDFEGLKRGQVKTKTSDIQKWMPYAKSDRIKKLLRQLIDDKFITRIVSAKNDIDFSVYEICQYELFSGEIGQNRGMNTTGTPPEHHQIDNKLESLNNIHDDLTEWNTTGTPPEHHPMFFLIEERNKRKKEELNTEQNFSDEKCLPTDIIINDLPIKVKKKAVKKPKKTTKADLTKAVGYLSAMFKPDGSPETRGFPWPNREQITVVAETLLDIYTVDKIKAWYDHFVVQGRIGKMRWEPSEFIKGIKHFHGGHIEIDTSEDLPNMLEAMDRETERIAALKMMEIS